MVKKKSMDQIEKNRKETRIECRLTYKQKKLIQKKAKDCGMSVSKYMVLCAEKGKVGNGNEKLKNYEIVTLAQELVRYVQDRYGSSCEDEELNRKVETLWEMLW